MRKILFHNGIKFTSYKNLNIVANKIFLRAFSTTNQSEQRVYSNSLKYLFNTNIIGKKLPCFEVYSSQIEILNQPMDFYLAILVTFIS
jgi:hypothetical protein